MIRLADAKCDRNGVLVIKDSELEAFAYRQLRDYQKGYFDVPHPLNVDDFVENYLQITVKYHGLSLDKSIYGATALVDGIMPIVDSSGGISCRSIKKGQIFIDCEACSNKETTIRFTLLHEAEHSQFDIHVDIERLSLADSLSDTVHQLFGGCRSARSWSPREWMEHHANRYAVYLLMPTRFVKALWKKYHDQCFKGKRITAARPKRLWALICKIAEELNVAKYSIALRLRELKIISDDVFKSLNISKWEEQK